ncbi:MAG TPA: TauD/TfdA family dioxygenase [Steroidobacteraceae bacterium]|jgi:gamma-butyrobetaine dioxygenase|nr:TauD/TfdA family dioxygenase [Steroidobacteraceae bacterium]
MNRVRLKLETTPPRVLAESGQSAVELPALWLRERCQDPVNLDAHTEQRLFDPHRLPDDLSLVSIEAHGEDRARLAFSDGYSGDYELHRLADELDQEDGLPREIPWRADLPLEAISVDGRALDSDGLRLRSIEILLSHGIVIIRNLPTHPECILEVARRFGYVRETNFGRLFEVYSRPGSNDLAYRPVPLGAHTDNPYREPVPGVQLLHCLVNETTGGWSTLVDSLSVAAALQEEDPQGLELLASTPVRFRFIDANEELIERRPIVQRDASGRMTGVHYSPRLDYLPLLDAATTRRFQRARRRLSELFADRRFELRFPLRAGELMMFNNSRVLHGRTAYDPNEGRRHLQGCYIDLDGPRSLYRTLGRSLSAASRVR